MYTFETAYYACQSNPLFAFVRYPDGNIEPICGEHSNPFPTNCILHIVPGSFNPLHDGHRALYNEASNMNQGGVPNIACYEMSIDRANKGTVGLEAMSGRVEQFTNEPIIISKHPLFYDKTGVLAAIRNIYIHIGIDTALRIVAMHSTVGTQGIRAGFYVYPREINDRVWTIDDLPGEKPINFHAAAASGNALVGINSTKIRQEMGIEEIGLQKSSN